MKSQTARALKVTSCLVAAASAVWIGVGSCTREAEWPTPLPSDEPPPPPPTVEPPAAPGPAGPPRATGADNARSVVGYNLDYPGDWTGMPPFIDMMKNARAWQGACSEADPHCDPQAHLSLDEHGWVRSLRYRDDPAKSYERVETVVFTNKHQTGCDGDFVLDYQGSGEVELTNASVTQRDPAARRIRFRPGDGSVFVRIASEAPGGADYVRNIRVYRADQSEALAKGKIFNPDMLAYLAPFGSLRFMDWMESNEKGLCSGGDKAGEDCSGKPEECGGGRCVVAGVWAERPRMDQVSALARSQFLDNQHPERGVRVGGYPVELMVALANEVGADPHFNMPAQFEDEYVREFARFVKEHLASNLRATVEYSNETWNWGFPQAHYVHREGRKLWPDEGSAWVQFAGSRMQHQCRLWKEVFGEDKPRVRCLISPQTGWPDMARNMLDCPAWARQHPDLGACYEGTDAVAITGYFAGCLQEPQNEKHLRAWLAKGRDYALGQFFTQLEHGGLLRCAEEGTRSSLDDVIELYSVFGRMAESRGLELYVYESGTHFNYDGKDRAIQQLFVDATRDPRMGQLYTRNLRAFKQAGGTIINAWGWVDANDMWANSDSLSDRAHPKYRALSDFGKNEACAWERCDRSLR